MAGLETPSPIHNGRETACNSLPGDSSSAAMPGLSRVGVFWDMERYCALGAGLWWC